MHVRYRLKKDLIRACQILYQQGYLTGMDGNLSVRLEDDTILTTPTGRNKGWIREDDLVLCDLDGISLEVSKRPSTELKMHLKVYEQRPDIKAVVHCHPVFATTYAASNKSLDGCYLTESIVAIGRVPKAKLAVPSTDEIPDSITPLIDSNDMLLLANHGALAYGVDLEAAVSRIESLEHFAKLSYYLELANIQNEVDTDTIKRLEALRPVYGLREQFNACRVKSNDRKNEAQISDREKEINEIIALVLKELNK